MLIQLDEIRGQITLRDFELPASDLPQLADVEKSEGLEFAAPISVTIKLSRIGEMVEATGQVSTVVKHRCGRCLIPFELSLSADFEVTFTKGPILVHDDSRSGDGSEIELTAEELGLIPFQGDEIDLTETIQEQVILALPLRPLCNSRCKGLCPHCGVDLNRESCLCAPAEFEGKFAALKGFKIE